MPEVKVTEAIQGDIDDVFRMIQDFEAYPTFMPSLNRVDIIERGDGWAISAWDTTLNGMRFCWKERDIIYPDEHRITYQKTEGDLKRFEGEWALKQEGNHTHVTFTVDFDFGVPMLASLLNPVAKIKLRQNSEMMLRGIKERFERDESIIGG